MLIRCLRVNSIIPHKMQETGSKYDKNDAGQGCAVFEDRHFEVMGDVPRRRTT